MDNRHRGREPKTVNVLMLLIIFFIAGLTITGISISYYLPVSGDSIGHAYSFLSANTIINHHQEAFAQGTTPSLPQSLLQDLPLPEGAINAASLVDGVTITGVNIVDGNQISIGLNYSGTNATTPAVNLMSIVVGLSPEQVASLAIGFLDILGSNASSSAPFDQFASSVGTLNNVTGTQSLPAGWNSPTNVTIKLQGNAPPTGEVQFYTIQVTPLT